MHKGGNSMAGLCRRLFAHRDTSHYDHTYCIFLSIGVDKCPRSHRWQDLDFLTQAWGEGICNATSRDIDVHHHAIKVLISPVQPIGGFENPENRSNNNHETGCVISGWFTIAIVFKTWGPAKIYRLVSPFDAATMFHESKEEVVRLHLKLILLHKSQRKRFHIVIISLSQEK